MSSIETAVFRGNVDIQSTSTGPTINELKSSATNALNNLNSHISDHDSSESANATARADLQTAVDTNKSPTDDTIASLQTSVDNNETDMESESPTETSNRLTAVDDLNTNVSNGTTFVDNEISRLDDLHTSDDARLTQTENELKTRDDDIDQKTSDAVVLEQQRFDNQEPGLSESEQFFVIDDAAQTIALGNHKIVIEGDLEQGGSSAPAPSGGGVGTFGNPEDLSGSIEIDTNTAPFDVFHNATNHPHNHTSISGPHSTEADAISKSSAAGLTSPSVDECIVVPDVGTGSPIELALVSHSGGFAACTM
eukprot:jgi/Bigna1/144372/aug1.87_g19080